MTHASIFSGIGGPEVAAAMLGWDNAFHCEINPFGRRVLEYWFPESKSYEDVTKTDFSEWRGKIDVLTAGFPCQPFSYAGKREGADDERYLWPEACRVISQVRPTWFVGENVAGILTMVEGGVRTSLGSETSLFGEGGDLYEQRRPYTIERICQELESLGYSVQPVLIPAGAVGAPHRRNRVFIIAYAENSHNDGRSKREYAEQRDKRDKRDFGSRDTERVCREARTVPADTFCFGRGNTRQYDYGESTQPQQRERGELQFGGTSGASGWWREFPTVSPVHRGNDGLPFPLDDLTISAGKWRTESIKAYGNAIVPQVMYRIFQAINQLNQ